ncbi:PEBP family protein [Galdieria sulphuraria]|uniref:PEBP family protein n=1 Tax=Galdieria sulphuraria TaxID=130081 RepID=M2XQA1_GALSU|nr:PEBP family protein [Galdieria sulphuraria]EME32397.1 PEBP family protein [Galdieria sulphuraria]|eukprot:XP_005708917.1 PEBP family protein [Galdieria sulphuraria]
MNEERYLLGQSQGSFKDVYQRKLITNCKVILCVLACTGLIVFQESFYSISSRRKSSGNSPSLTLYSPCFRNGTHIPAKFGCSNCGQVANSVPLTWRLDGVSGSADMTSLLLMHDPDAVSVTGLDFIHWFVINMTLTDNAVIIPENASGNVKFMPEGSVELRNSNNKTGYHPPCPPDKDHTYIFQVCLINRMSKRLDWITFYDARDIVHRLEGCLCGTLKGVYPRVTTEKRKDISD